LKLLDVFFVVFWEEIPFDSFARLVGASGDLSEFFID
jgi:hypothetical protein